jgi:hypothetical protein
MRLETNRGHLSDDDVARSVQHNRPGRYRDVVPFRDWIGDTMAVEQLKRCDGFNAFHTFLLHSAVAQIKLFKAPGRTQSRNAVEGPTMVEAQLSKGRKVLKPVDSLCRDLRAAEDEGLQQQVIRQGAHISNLGVEQR